MKPRDKKVRPVFDHLVALTDERSVLAEALHAAPCPERAYRLDDAARGLVVACREPRPDEALLRLHGCYLRFVLAALDPNGRCYQRMGPDGTWMGRPAVGDWWGRAVWSLGIAALQSPTAGQRARALAGFRVAAQQRSSSRRSMAFAVIGAAAALHSRPGEPAARRLLRDGVRMIVRSSSQTGWPPATAALNDADATIAEALLVAGDAVAGGALQGRGLELLALVLRAESRDNHFSLSALSPTVLRPAEPAQQHPSAVAATADACASAYRITGDPRWLSGINMAWRWFLGDNDAGAPMFDAVSGGGYDEPQADGPEVHQSAESTLAMLSTAQHARYVQQLR